MVKINLLPPHVHQGSSRWKVATLWGVACAGLVVGFLMWASSLNDQANKIKADEDAIAGIATDADNTQKKADAVNGEAAAVKGKEAFVASAIEHNIKTYPSVTSHIRDYTIKTVVYSDLNMAGNTATMNAYAPSLAEIGKYMMWMEHNPNISNVSVGVASLPVVTMNGVVAGGGGQQQQAGLRPPSGIGHNFVVRLTLTQPVATGPTYPSGGGAPGGGGGGNMPGGGMPGGGSGGGAPAGGSGGGGKMGATV